MKKLLVVGAVPNAAENYFNVKAMLDKVDMETLEFTVAADIKMCKNIFFGGGILGCQPYNSLYLYQDIFWPCILPIN